MNLHVYSFITINKVQVKLSFHENICLKLVLKNIKLPTKYNCIIIWFHFNLIMIIIDIYVIILICIHLYKKCTCLYFYHKLDIK